MSRKARVLPSLRRDEVGEERFGIAMEVGFHAKRVVHLIGVPRRELFLDAGERRAERSRSTDGMSGPSV